MFQNICMVHIMHIWGNINSTGVPDVFCDFWKQVGQWEVEVYNAVDEKEFMSGTIFMVRFTVSCRFPLTSEQRFGLPLCKSFILLSFMNLLCNPEILSCHVNSRNGLV